MASVPTDSTYNNQNIENSGTQIDVTGSNTEPIVEVSCDDSYRVGFNVQNISDKPITGFIIRASLDGCAVNTEKNPDDSFVFDSNYQGYQWKYSHKLGPRELGFGDIYVIPKQIKNQKLIFSFYMLDGKTPLKNDNNNPEVVKVRINVTDAPDEPEPFDVTDIDIGGKIVQSDTNEKNIVFTVKNLSYCNNLQGLMIKIPTKYFPNYKIEKMNEGEASVEDGNYVWRYDERLKKRYGTQITIKCPIDDPPPCGFDFYTFDGKTKISTCQIVK